MTPFIGSNHVMIYDSFPSRSISSRTKEQIAAICFCEESDINVTICDVQRQVGGDDCGLFALAFAAAVCAGQNPSEVNFIQHRFRDHLIHCLEKRLLECFPTSRRGRKNGLSETHYIPVFCHCRQPDDGSRMIECSRCKEWYHDDCEHVPVTVWSKKNKDNKKWCCRNC